MLSANPGLVKDSASVGKKTVVNDVGLEPGFIQKISKRVKFADLNEVISTNQEPSVVLEDFINEEQKDSNQLSEKIEISEEHGNEE